MPYKLTDSGVIVAELFVGDICVNPKNGPQEFLDHIRRSLEEITLWRRRPYIVRCGEIWQIFCLDGNRSDQPSMWAQTDTLESASVLACF